MHINSRTKFQLGFSKFQFFNDQNCQEGGTASPCQILSTSLQPWPRYRDLSIFQDGGRRHLGFLKKIEFLTVRTVKKVELLLCAKFHLNRSNRGRLYVSFNIMLVWLENAYLRPFLGFLGHISP